MEETVLDFGGFLVSQALFDVSAAISSPLNVNAG
jgi:hypothetical protein